MNDPEQMTAAAAKEPLFHGNMPSPSGVRRRRRPMLMLGMSGVLVVLFGLPLMSLFTKAATSQFHSYIVLVPFISAYLLFSRKEALPSSYTTSFLAAAALALLGSAILIFALLAGRDEGLSRDGSLSLTILSFVCLTGSAGFLILGTAWMVKAAFPFFFLVFLVPMPAGMMSTLEIASQHASAAAADVFFRLGNTPYIHEGMIFQLPNINIRVAQECSGIRSSWVLFITSVLAANTFLRTNWKRALLVSVVIPLGILRNGFRVWVIGLLCVHFGPRMIDSPIHHHGGPLFFALSLIPLFLLVAWLRRGETFPRQVATQPSVPSGARGQ